MGSVPIWQPLSVIVVIQYLVQQLPHATRRLFLEATTCQLETSNSPTAQTKRVPARLKGNGWGPDIESQKKIVGIGGNLPASFYSHHIPAIFLGFPTWGPR